MVVVDPKTAAVGPRRSFTRVGMPTGRHFIDVANQPRNALSGGLGPPTLPSRPSLANNHSPAFDRLVPTEPPCRSVGAKRSGATGDRGSLVSPHGTGRVCRQVRNVPASWFQARCELAVSRWPTLRQIVEGAVRGFTSGYLSPVAPLARTARGARARKLPVDLDFG